MLNGGSQPEGNVTGIALPGAARFFAKQGIDLRHTCCSHPRAIASCGKPGLLRSLTTTAQSSSRRPQADGFVFNACLLLRQYPPGACCLPLDRVSCQRERPVCL